MQTFTVTADAIVGSTFVDLNSSGTTKLSFTTATANERVIITFSTGCVVTSGKGFVEMEILVDPAGSVGEFVSPPTNQVNSAGSLLCLGDASATSAGAGAGATVVASVRPAVAGTNTVRVRANFGAEAPGSQAVIKFSGTSPAVVQ